MLGRTDSRPRLLVLLLVMVLVSAALTIRLGYWQIVRGAELSWRAERQTTSRIEIPSRRGAIYDRSGTVVLASSVELDRLVAAPAQLSTADRRVVANELIRILGLEGDAAADLMAKMTTTKPYQILVRELTPEMSEAIRLAARDKRISQVGLEPESIRIYPQDGGGPDSTLAAHVIGFVNREGAGQYGVEQRYQDMLGGTPTIVDARRDMASRLIVDDDAILEAGIPGVDLSLTIDAGLQLSVEEELLATWLVDNAGSASAVVMDPYTGEIYAEATYPSYSGNDYRSVASTDASRFIDPIVSEVYEPGSVLKMITAVAAFEQGTATPLTKFADAASLKLDDGKARIGNADRKSMGTMELQDALAYSRNVVAAKLALGLAPTTREASAILHETWTRLGFGKRTGVDLSGEVSGIVNDPTIQAWREIDLANASFGQGIAVTPLQLAVAYAAMVNGGTLVRPHVVKAIGDEPTVIGNPVQVLDPALSPTMMSLMSRVLTEVDVYRARTQVPGFYVGGKTGTAQIWDPALNGGRGAFKTNIFNYTFVGYIGRRANHPDLVIAVRIHEARPVVRAQGWLEMPRMSFELFQRIASTAINTPGLLPEIVDPEPADGGSRTGYGPAGATGPRWPGAAP